MFVTRSPADQFTPIVELDVKLVPPAQADTHSIGPVLFPPELLPEPLPPVLLPPVFQI